MIRTNDIIRALRSGDGRQILMVAAAAADLIEDQDERLGIIAEGRDLIDRKELTEQLVLTSATAGHLNGEQMMEVIEHLVRSMKGVR